MSKKPHRLAIPHFPSPSVQYDAGNEAQYRRVVESAISDLLTRDAIYLQSPDGAFWRVTVDNTGTLSTAVVS